MRTIALSLALAACSAAPEQDNAATDNVTQINATAPEPATSASAAVPAEAADTGAVPELGEMQTFKDWVVGCDNTRSCKAVALAPGDGAERPLLASVARAADGQVTVRITGTEAADRTGTLTVDGKPILRGGTSDGESIAFTGDPARRAAEALAQGRAATVAGSGPASPLSLAGAAAALRWMDAQQALAGSPGAFVAKGQRPIDAAPLPAVPVIRAVAGFGPARPLPAAEAAALRKRAGCTIAEYLDPAPEGTMADLGGGATLILVPCDSGAYNLMSAAFVRRGDTTDPAQFDADTGMSPDPQPIAQPVNADWQDGELTTFAKGRGLGDCGSMQRFAWDGRRFRLVEEKSMGECRGSTDYITLWRARVVR